MKSVSSFLIGDDNMTFQRETGGGYPNVSLYEKRGEPQFTPSVVDYIPSEKLTQVEMTQTPFAMEQQIPLEKGQSVMGSSVNEGTSIPDLLVDVADMQIQTSLPPASVDLQEDDRKSMEKIGYTHDWIRQVEAAGTLVDIPAPSQVNAATTIVQATTVVTDKRKKEEKQKKSKSVEKSHHHRHHSETDEKRRDRSESESGRHHRHKSESHRSDESRSHSDEGKSRKSRKTVEPSKSHRDKDGRSDRETVKSRNTSEPESDRKTRDKSTGKKSKSESESKKHKTPRDVKRKDKEKEEKKDRSGPSGKSRSIDNLSITPREGPPSRAATSLTSGSGGAVPTAPVVPVPAMPPGHLAPVPNDAISIPQHIIIPTSQFTGSEPRKVQISSEITISYPGTQEFGDSVPVVNTPGPQSTLAGSTNVLTTGRRSQQDLYESSRTGGATAL